MTFSKGVRRDSVLNSQRFWIDSICTYSYRTAIKYLGNLRFMPQYSEGLDFARAGEAYTHYFQDKILYYGGVHQKC